MAKYLDNDGLLYLWQKIKTKFATITDLDGKVDKVTGKGLSTNDYTTAEKNKLKDVASGAQVNIIETVKVNDTALTPSSKAVNITVPTKTSDITNDSGFITSADIPEGAAASTTTPKMDGTAAIGTEMAFARGDHVHPSDTSRVPTTRKVAGHALSADVTLVKSDVGLGNVDNTADIDKPISTAQQTALNDKVDKETGYGLASVANATGTIYSQIGLSGEDFSVVEVKKDSTATNVKMLNEGGVGTLMTLMNTAMSNKADADSVYTKSEVYTKTETDTALNNKVDKVTGKGLSTNDYTTAEKNKLAGISVTSNVESDTFTIADGAGNTVEVFSADFLPLAYYSKTEVNGMMSGALTTVEGMISSAVTNMYKYKGSVATVSALPSSDNTTGDVYNVEATGMNYAWNGTAWDALGEIFTITSISNSDIDTIVAS